jgi:hypothetical protein
VSYLRMIKAAVVILTSHTINEIVFMVYLASNTGLEMLVGLQLGVGTGVIT